MPNIQPQAPTQALWVHLTFGWRTGSAPMKGSPTLHSTPPPSLMYLISLRKDQDSFRPFGSFPALTVLHFEF